MTIDDVIILHGVVACSSRLCLCSAKHLQDVRVERQVAQASALCCRLSHVNVSAVTTNGWNLLILTNKALLSLAPSRWRWGLSSESAHRPVSQRDVASSTRTSLSSVEFSRSEQLLQDAFEPPHRGESLSPALQMS